MYFNRHEALAGDPKTRSGRRQIKSRPMSATAEWIPLTVPPSLTTSSFNARSDSSR